MVDVFVLNVYYVLLVHELIYFPLKKKSVFKSKGNNSILERKKKKHTFFILAVLRVSLIDVEAISCLCKSVAVDIGIVESSNSYCCL